MLVCRLHVRAALDTANQQHQMLSARASARFARYFSPFSQSNYFQFLVEISEQWLVSQNILLRRPATLAGDCMEGSDLSRGPPQGSSSCTQESSFSAMSVVVGPSMRGSRFYWGWTTGWSNLLLRKERRLRLGSWTGAGEDYQEPSGAIEIFRPFIRAPWPFEA